MFLNAFFIIFSFSCMHMWDKSKLRNKRETQDYECVFSIPPHVRTWVLQERQKHVPFLKRAGVEYNTDVWMDAFRKTFTASSTELSNKSIRVSNKLMLT